MNTNMPKDAFAIVEGKDGKSRWFKIGAAFSNNDGSMNIFLHAFPCDGKIQIRDRKKAQNENDD